MDKKGGRPRPASGKRFVPGAGPAVVPFELVAPGTPTEAVDLLARARPGEAVVLAGGTDLLLDLDAGRVAPRTVVSLRRLPWARLRRVGDRLEIGSTLPLRAIERDPRVATDLPGLASAIRAVGSVALRERATLGGNLARASPASDLLPILLALEARVRLVGPVGPRELPLAELLHGPRETTLTAGELIAAVDIPAARPSAYLWQRVRPSNDISQVGVAVARAPGSPGWRVALGGVYPTPLRLPSVEAILAAPSPAATAVELAAQEAALRAPFVTDKRATEAYRRRLVAALVRRAVRTLAPSAAATGAAR